MNLNHKLIADARAHQTLDLRALIIPWLCFKLFIKFKPSADYKNSNRHHSGFTFYGHEHSCTYKQCLFGHVKEIHLDRMKGYNELVKKVERDYKGKYTSAKIYGRRPGELLFNTVHREYYMGKLDKEKVNDPVIDVADAFKILKYKIESGLLIIVE